MNIKHGLLIALAGGGALVGTQTDLLKPTNINADRRSESNGSYNDEMMGLYGEDDDDETDASGVSEASSEEEIANMATEDLGEGLGVNGEAKFTSFGKTGQNSSYADGQITVGGKTYPFRSGGGGNGYLPPGEYVVSNGRRRSDVSSMQVGGYGYSFDLSDKYDSRVGKGRSLLRIHPDGGNPGTLGCIGIKGNAATQKQFYESLQQELQSNGGRIKIKVG